ncbi:tRNA (guanosine(37)-N1)-methyltransferase TrmD [Pseudoclavibacter chungangensis]|uniref:tRNA (guanine-N(1)-)-methyltransferase n=1 Tax=Pseudoclavibacter chungangensis TaxID=587635 RepID=A0A7J5C1G3_9MICO|nr:tRNA (guanosine(37)-N1)-methyltransferase TrmD [Pseudoclavibacter chungangensis]KAB1659582.1 tRNA (guanosine(37)-N1)-methyltransferase TrmD [Pseudoclavibacter chungangensis]NYJ67404.1 tRNA (guanine37-N1)-methyltransferase [Pseudoclavibacter chungangensis]
MRVDIVTIFPDYFSVLDLSLLGKARSHGLIDVRVHDLRDATTDRHRTVDDTPYGGGAGMVMTPEPWGRTLDAILGATAPDPLASPGVDGVAADDAPTDVAAPGVPSLVSHDDRERPLVVFPSPAGAPFTQATARRYAAESHIVFGCGRYEGIDHRVFEDTARRARVELVSLGDYVLNGGEVAVLAMVEAFGRLLPGVVGNPESLVEESHEDGLLEYPSYTKPATWRGLEVPAVLLSGHHARVAEWRHEQQIERTRAVRPDLLAGRADAAE